MRRPLAPAVLFVLSSLLGCGVAAAPDSEPPLGQGADPGVAAPAAELAQLSEGGLGAPAGKRVGPPDVAPVTIGKLRFEAIHWGRDRGFGQNGGYIAAYDAAGGAELWTLKVYQIDYDSEMEEDVQDIFIETMSKSTSGDRLEITDERGRRYIVDPGTRSVQAR